MQVIKIGLDYHVAPLEIREKITFSEDEVVTASNLLRETDQVLEHVIISTCNRTEVFAVVSDAVKGEEALRSFLTNWFHLTKVDYVKYFQQLNDNDAIEHLFKLTSGLSSMVLGETQILGQVRDSFLAAQQAGATGKLLNELFKRAITFAKRAHRETALGEHAVSISYVAVEQIKKLFHGLTHASVLVIGAGEMGKLALKNILAAGVEDVTIMNRTFSRAQELAATHNVRAVPMEKLFHALQQADVLISCTGSSGRVIDQDLLRPIQENRDEKSLTIIDIAVPRDVETSVSELPGITLYDVDDLQSVVDENIDARKAAARQISSNIAEEIESYNDWLRMLVAVPIIRALHEKSVSIQETTLQSISRKMPDLTEREMKVLEKHTSSIVHQLLRQPIEVVKHMGKQEQAEEQLGLVKQIFGLTITE